MPRALRFQAHVPLKFWEKCVLTAAFLINRLPSSVLFGKSPYEVFHGHLPTLDIIRVFRYLCYATTLNNTDKFSQRSRPAIFMGYSTSQKGYKLYNISTGTFFVSRDISFMETVFPSKYPKSTFLHTLSSGSIPTFPTSVTASTCDDSFPALSPSIPAPDPPSPLVIIPYLNICHLHLLSFLLHFQFTHFHLRLLFFLLHQHHLLYGLLLLQLCPQHYITRIFLLFLQLP